MIRYKVSPLFGKKYPLYHCNLYPGGGVLSFSSDGGVPLKRQIRTDL